MTNQEAINVLKEESCYECTYGTYEGASVCKAEGCCLKDATIKSIKALEKQIAKKPVFKIHENRIPEEQKQPYCPSCDEWFYEEDKMNHCYMCGQKLDWSDTE